MQRSKGNDVRLPYFIRTFFRWLLQCNDLIHKLNMRIECFIYTRHLQRSCTIKTKYSNHWAMLLYTLQNKADKYINKRKTLELIRLIFSSIKYYLLLFPQHLRHWRRHFLHNFFWRKLTDILKRKWKLIDLRLLLMWKSEIYGSGLRKQLLKFYFYVKSFNMNS